MKKTKTSKMERILLLIPSGDVQHLNELSKNLNINRMVLIRFAIKEYLNNPTIPEINGKDHSKQRSQAA